MQEKGHCKHGEFILNEGCPQCMAERRAKGITPAQDEMEDGLNSEGLTLTGEEPAAETALAKVLCLKEGSCEHLDGAYCRIKSIDCAFSEKAGTPTPEAAYERHFAPPEPKQHSVAETALINAPGADIQVISYYNEALKLQEYAEKRVIATLEDIKVATDDLAIISKLKKAMDSKKSAKLDPLKAQTEAIRGTYNYLMAPVLEADKITREKMLAFDREQRRIRAEQEDINRKRQEAAEAEMRLKGKLTEPVELIEVSPDVRTTVSTELGMTGQTDHWKYEVIDFALLPDEFKVADTAMLNTIAKKHHDQKQIPGVRFYNEPFITVRPR